jgi:hypothetical protein
MNEGQQGLWKRDEKCTQNFVGEHLEKRIKKLSHMEIGYKGMV